jgi:hypothetical protein
LSACRYHAGAAREEDDGRRIGRERATDDGGLIYVVNHGIRHAPADVQARLDAGEPVDRSLVYFRTSPTFETAPGRHE